MLLTLATAAIVLVYVVVYHRCPAVVVARVVVACMPGRGGSANQHRLPGWEKPPWRVQACLARDELCVLRVLRISYMILRQRLKSSYKILNQRLSGRRSRGSQG